MTMQIDQHTAKNKIKAKREITCLYSWRQIPISQALIDKMIEELPEWPDQEQNYKKKHISDFYHSYQISRATYYDLLAMHPRLKAGHEIAMQKLGERLWDRCTEKELDWKPVYHRLWKYGTELKEDYQYHQDSAKEQIETGPQWKFIQMTTERTDKLDKFMEEKKAKETKRLQ